MSLPLSHNPALDRTSRPSENEALTFSQLRTSLIKVLRNSPESREPICDALELIESLQQQIETKRHPDANAPRETRPAPRDEPSQEYLVQQTADGAFLTERRPSGAQPFRCPRDVYDAAAQALATTAGQPLHFEDLLDRLNQLTHQRQPDYRLRVCLRFWLHHQVIERFRTRYRATDPATFPQTAATLWQNAQSC
jgi:hypothetical protein